MYRVVHPVDRVTSGYFSWTKAKNLRGSRVRLSASSHLASEQEATVYLKGWANCFQAQTLCLLWSPT